MNYKYTQPSITNKNTSYDGDVALTWINIVKKVSAVEIYSEISISVISWNIE